MKNRTVFALLLLIAGAFLVAGCGPSLVISDVDYSQPIESVSRPDSSGWVELPRQGLAFSIMPLQHAETGDTSTVSTEEVRMIRGREGFYYVTAPSYTHVYLFRPEKSELVLERRIAITETGIENPAFNQRNPYVVLINRDTGMSYHLNPDGIVKQSTSKNMDEAG